MSSYAYQQRRQQVQNLLSGLNYKDRSAAEIQILQLLHQLHSLQPQISNYVSNNGTKQQLFKLDGTIPTHHRSAQHNIPISIWIPLHFPTYGPICYVTTVSGMKITPNHMCVDNDGLVNHPYLYSWKPPQSTLVDFIGTLCSDFSKHPPLSPQQYNQYAQPPPYNPYTGASPYNQVAPQNQYNPYGAPKQYNPSAPQHFVSGPVVYGSYNQQFQQQQPPQQQQQQTVYKLIEYTKIYQSDFDTNGICYAIGTNLGKRDWVNPAQLNEISVTASGPMSDSVPCSAVVGRDAVPCFTASTHSQLAYFKIKFGPKREIKPTHYTLRHYSSSDTEAVRNWNLEASNDDYHWTVLRKHKNDTVLNKKGETYTWPIQTDEFWQTFRIILTGPNSNDSFNLACSGFEIYGKVKLHTVEPLSGAPSLDAAPQTQQAVTKDEVNLEIEEEDEKIQVVGNQFMSELDNVIRSHFAFMRKQEKNVNKFISSTGQNAKMLQTAKNVALETEKDLLQKIMNISTMSDFLKDIILIENLFNSVYTQQLQTKQKEARKKYAPNLSKYETTNSKPITKATSFVDLLFYAKTDLSSFKKWLQKVANECNEQNIKIVSNSGAKEKNIERAFYKSFYVYSATFGDKGHQQMTDVLRCSLVFDDFVDLYRCFGIIEKMSQPNGGILRAKDRFNPKQIPFGYRDILININCPKSEIPIICEVQLHHSTFYRHKKVSHEMYKKARIFEDRVSGDNLAYKYANQYIKSSVGDKTYEYEGKEVEVDSGDPRQTLVEWGLSQYAEKLIDEEGYEDTEDWKELTLKELTDELGFKKGHAKKFLRKVKDL